MYRNAKQRCLSDFAFRVWVTSWSYAADQQPPSPYLHEVDALAHAASFGRPRKATLAAMAELVRLGAWERTDDGYKVHDLKLKADALSGAERTRKWRRGGDTGSDGDVTPTVTETVTTGDEAVTETPSRARSAHPHSPVPNPEGSLDPPKGSQSGKPVDNGAAGKRPIRKGVNGQEYAVGEVGANANGFTRVESSVVASAFQAIKAKEASS